MSSTNDGTVSKQEQFLWGVQTLMLLNAQNLALENETAIKDRHLISATGNFTNIHLALVASKRIPPNKDVTDAIHEFYYSFIPEYKDMANRPTHSWLVGIR
ncbi:MAG: hypothetical protein KAS85_11510 [Rhodobacteraceae bacterium]|nr:hypothetical protein [Paracoccaceae bacterium]